MVCMDEVSDKVWKIWYIDKSEKPLKRLWIIFFYFRSLKYLNFQTCSAILGGILLSSILFIHIVAMFIGAIAAATSGIMAL